MMADVTTALWLSLVGDQAVAVEIAKKMHLERNRSRSFRLFVEGVTKFLSQ